MSVSNDFLFDENGGFCPENLCDYGGHDVEGISNSGQAGNKRGYVGILLTDADVYGTSFMEDIEVGIHSGYVHIGANNIYDYVRGIVGEAAWDDMDTDFDTPLPTSDAIELRLGRKGNDLVILDTVLYFEDADSYFGNLNCRGCLDLNRFSSAEKQALIDAALDAAHESCGLDKADILNGLVDWDVDKKLTDDYYEGCLFDKNGTFCPENMTGVEQLNDRSANLFEASGPSSCDHFTVFFRGVEGFCSLKDDLDNGAKSGKTRIGDMDKYIDKVISTEPDGAAHNLSGRPRPEPDYICVDIGVDNGEFEILDSRLCFYDDDMYDVDFTCGDFLRIGLLSDSERTGIIDFALNTAFYRNGLTRDEVKGRLIDQQAVDYNALEAKAMDSAYNRLMVEMMNQRDDEFELGDYNDDYDDGDGFDDYDE